MSEARRPRHSRAESAIREEPFAFRNGAGLLLRGTLLYRWNEAPQPASPQQQHRGLKAQAPHTPTPISTVPPPPHLFSIASTPSSSPASAASLPNSATLSPSTPSALTSALADLKIDTPTLSRTASRTTSPVGSPQHAARLSSGAPSITASPTSASYHTLTGGSSSSPPSPCFASTLASPHSQTASMPLAHFAGPAQPLSFPVPSPPLAAPRVAIVCHGMAVHSQWGFLPELCDAVLKEVSGMSAVLRFDFTGCGQSEGQFDFGGYRKQTDDIQAAVAAMRARGYAVHALLGHSMGGNCVLLHSSAHPDIPNVVNISGRYAMTRGLPFGPEQLASLQQQGWFDWKPRGALVDSVRVTQETINERLSLDMDCARRIGSSRDELGHYRVRVLTVHGNNDAQVPVQDAHQYAELISNHTLRTLDDCDHNYTTPQAKLMLVTTVCEWMSKEATNDKRQSTGSLGGAADSNHSSPLRSTTLPPPHPNPIHSTPGQAGAMSSALASASSIGAAISPATSFPLSTSPSSSHTAARSLVSHRRSPSL